MNYNYSQVKRVEEFYKLNWPQPPEEPGLTELATVKAIWEPLLSPDLAILLFPTAKFGTSNAFKGSFQRFLNCFSLFLCSASIFIIF